jgi:GT2 family glycosyltransferase
MTPGLRHCIVIPFLNRLELVARCLASLTSQRMGETHFLLMDDGSEPAASEHPELRLWLIDPNVHLIRHRRNWGVAAARNSALHWCRRNGFDLVIMIDSDCEPGPDLIEQHLDLQERFPRATVIAGGIVGRGQGILAWLDGLLSFPNSKPFGEVREAANTLYHLPMTNIALNLSRLPDRDFVFDERLNTGEDSFLIRELLRRGDVMVSSPDPVVFHQDRETLRSVIAHHQEWGHHQYFVQLGSDFSRPVFNLTYRAGFLIVFGMCLPAYALVGGALNVLPWLRYRPKTALAFLPAVAIWLAKGFAVMRAAANPYAVLRQARPFVEYIEVTSRDRDRVTV